MSSVSRLKRKAVALAALIAIGLTALVVAGYISVKNGLPRPNLTSKEAQSEAYHQLKLYCCENDLDVGLFGPAQVKRGTLAHAQLRRDGSVYETYAPTWDFYYTYQGHPAVTVLASYDSETGITEAHPLK